MSVAPWLEPNGESRNEDDIVVLSDATWADYQRILEIRGDHAVPRIAYLNGALEIARPSRDHERVKRAVGCLVEAWCLEKGIEFTTNGSWTIADKKRDCGVEPDECYLIGNVDIDVPTLPDLAIEVVWSRGGIKKLEIYRSLGVREVWIWSRNRIEVFALEDDAYVRSEKSRVLPDLDLALLVSYLDRPTSRAIRDFLAAIRNG